jgi:hypothetical protein
MRTLPRQDQLQPVHITDLTSCRQRALRSLARSRDCPEIGWDFANV